MKDDVIGFYLVCAAVILAIAIGTAPINLEKYRVGVCLEQFEVVMTLNERTRAVMTLRCMGIRI